MKINVTIKEWIWWCKLSDNKRFNIIKEAHKKWLKKKHKKAK